MKSKQKIEQIEHALNDICTHKLFAKSLVYPRLLRYLVEKAIAKEDLKEYTIGVDLFGSNYRSDKNDGTVRIYMYKLRKRLDAYYSEVNDSLDIYFEIEKGQYNLKFIAQKEYNEQQLSSVIQIQLKHIKRFALGIVGLVCVCVIASFYFKRTSPVWEKFLSNGEKTKLVISDNYVLMANNEYGEKHATLYGTINSDEDFFEFKGNYPERKLEMTDFTLFTKMAPYCTQILTKWFLEHDAYFELAFENELSLNDIKENNIVFIGPKKSMNLSESFFLENSAVFYPCKEGYIYKKDDFEKKYVTKHLPKAKVEYAMVSYGSVSTGKESIYFVSNHDIGVMATLRNFTNKDWLEAFLEQLPSDNSHFNALFKVSGIHRTDLSCELVELEIID